MITVKHESGVRVTAPTQELAERALNHRVTQLGHARLCVCTICTGSTFTTFAASKDDMSSHP